jgi:hypothetical protein
LSIRSYTRRPCGARGFFHASIVAVKNRDPSKTIIEIGLDGFSALIKK